MSLWCFIGFAASVVFSSGCWMYAAYCWGYADGVRWAGKLYRGEL